MENTKVKFMFLKKHPILKDILSLICFVGCVIAGTLLLNTYVFRSYNVVGQSMENTLHNDDRVIVNRLAVSNAHFKGQEYVPERGQIIVFVNGEASGPLTCGAQKDVTDQYIIKRVIAFPGERVVVKDGVMTIYNEEYPDGFVYDDEWRVGDNNEEGPKKYTSNEVDVTVPEGELFVSGDNREGSYSFDSRYEAFGTIPYCRVIGPVVLRLWPINKLKIF